MTMPARIRIHDDGDEIVWVDFDGEQIWELNHDDDGWAGIKRGIELVEKLAAKLGVRVQNDQDIV